MTLSSSSPAVRRALAAFASDVAGDSAIDSAVYDLQAYDASVPEGERYAAVTREGVFGIFADAEVASRTVVNRPLCDFSHPRPTLDAVAVAIPMSGPYKGIPLCKRHHAAVVAAGDAE